MTINILIKRKDNLLAFFIPKYVGCVKFTCTAKVLHGFEYFGRSASYC
jgi:hypothetical protein